MKPLAEHQKRNLDIELLRIIAMLAVVILHVSCFWFNLGSKQNYSLSLHLDASVNMLALIGVPVYALISGYVMLNQEIRWWRLVLLWLQLLFYGFVVATTYHVFVSPINSSIWRNLCNPSRVHVAGI